MLNKRNEILPDTKEALYDVYSLCGGVKSLATCYGLPVWFVEYELEYFDIIKKKPRNLGNGIPSIDANLLRSGLRIYKSIKCLAKVLGVEYHIVRESLLVSGIFVRAWTCSNTKQWKEEDLRRDLLACKNIIEMAKKYNCHKSTLIKILRKFDIDIPKEKYGKRKKYILDVKVLQSDYNTMGSLLAVSKKYGCSVYTIWKTFNALDVDYRNAGVTNDS